MKRARILYVDHATETGGAQLSLLDVFRCLDPARFEPVLLHAPGADWVGQAAAVGVRLVEEPLSGPLFGVQRESLRPGILRNLGSAVRAVRPILAIFRAIRRERPDIVHTNTLKTDLLGGVAAWLARRPVLWHVRDLLPPGPARSILRTTARVVRPRVIAISNPVRSMFDGFRSVHTTIVHNTVDLSTFIPARDRVSVRAALGLEDGALVVVVAGRLVPWKGHKTLIEAFSRLPEGLGDLRLLIVGECAFGDNRYRRELEGFAEERGIGERTLFTGQRDDVADLMAASDLFCLPSQNEPFGRVLVEAMAMELPVVATRGGGVPEIVEDGRTGLLVDVDDAAGMAEALAVLLADEPRRREMGRAGMQRVEEHFKLPGEVGGISAVYDSMLGEHDARRSSAVGGTRTRRSNPALKRLDSWTGSLALGALSLAERIRRRPVPEVAPQEVRRILIIKLCCMGDGLLAIPAIRAVTRHFPNASITCLCTSRNRDVFDGLPYFDEIIALGVSGTRGLREVLTAAGPGLLQLLRELLRRRFDVAIDLDLYFKATPAIAYLTGAPVRAGFDTEGTGRAHLFTHRAPRRRDQHEAECFLELVAALGALRVEDHLEFVIDPASEGAADELLAAEGISPETPLAVLVPGSSKNWPEKQWAADRFATVGDALADEYGLRLVLVGAAFERALGDRVAAAMKAPAVNLAGRTSVKQTGRVLRRARLTVSNDTGPMHLSAAVGTPVVAIFGPTDERKWRPWGEGHIVVADRSKCGRCYHLSEMPICQHRRCLTELPVEAVLAACRAVLGPPEGASA